MSLFDDLKKQVLDRMGSADPEAAQHPDFLAGIMEMLQKQGLSSLLEQFKSKGLGEVVSSWIGHGQNLPISAESLRSAISPDQIEALAQRAGMPAGQATELLAKYLPMLVDKLTPEGKIEVEGATP